MARLYLVLTHLLLPGPRLLAGWLLARCGRSDELRAQGDARGERGAPGSPLFSGAARLWEGGPDPAARRAAVKAPRGGPGGTALPLPAPTGPSEGLAPPPRQGNGPGRLHSGSRLCGGGAGLSP